MKDLNTVLKVVGTESVKFPIKETNVMLGTPIEELKLDNRSYNALIRNGICTIGDIVQNMSKLWNLRGFGKKCYNKTMYEICAFQYNQLDTKGKRNYLMRIVELNV